MLTAPKLEQILNAYNKQDVEELGMTLHDQLALEQIKLLRSIRGIIRFAVFGPLVVLVLFLFIVGLSSM